MGRLISLFALADLALMVIALIDCLSVDEGGIRALPRIAWVFIILLFSPIGGIAWFVAGRPVGTGSRAGVWRPGSGFPEAERPAAQRAPDDDPDFLRRLSPRTAQEDAQLLQAWEDDLRRREEDLRRRQQQEDPGSGQV